jgi:RimJ/RimL family protein N-acetyltransferase
VTDRRIGFRALEEPDLRMLHEWLQRPHVRRWWDEHATYEDVVAHYLPAIDGRDPTDLYLILLDDRPVGFVETYAVSDYPEYAAVVGVGEGVAGVDLFVAEEELTGKGLGTEVLRRFVPHVVFANPRTTACIAGPDVRNLASIRAFEKAGFRRVHDFVEPDDGKLHALVRLERASTGDSPHRPPRT